VVAQSLEAAVAWADVADGGPSPAWLDEAVIPTGDGGWRSVSALGLAVAANLAWQEVGDIIEKAARIFGDSDSVAAIAGMLAGAANPRGIPSEWIASLPERDRMQSLVGRLCSAPSDPSGRPVHTSAADPLRIAWVAGATVKVGVTLAPGKCGPSTLSSRIWQRDIGIDHGTLHQEGVGVLISLLEDQEIAAYGLESSPTRAAEKGIAFRHFPVPDLCAPSLAQAREIVNIVISGAERESEGPVVLHCLGGLGRAGTLAACVLVADGLSPKEAIRRVRAARPGAIQTASQVAFIRHFVAGRGRPSS
jgi:protein-tyrosine phosphatase